MDSSHAHRRPAEPRILYGRVAVYAASLLLAFVLGTIVGGRGQVSDAEVERYRAEVSELRRDNYDLEQQVAAYAAGQALPPGTQPEALGAEPGQAAAGEAPPEDPGGGQQDVAGADADVAETAELPPGASTYEVQAGDTLISIAEAVYGDGSKYELIASANGVDAQLEIGQELVIPAEPAEPEVEEAEAGAEVQAEGEPEGEPTPE